jgi:hypothetical protein
MRADIWPPLHEVERHNWLASTGSQSLTRVALVNAGLKYKQRGGQKSLLITIYIKEDYWPPFRIKLVHNGEMR